jgi:hypothetical protein
MNIKALRNVVTSKLGRQVLTVQKHSPTLLFAAGVVGVGATVFFACRATLKVEDVLEEHSHAKDMIDRAADDIRVQDYSEEDKRKDQILLYMRTTGRLFKLYAPAIVLGTLSVAALTGAHTTLSRRNVALTAAYAALEKGFREYRARLIGEYGEDKDREFRYGAREIEIIEETDKGPKTSMVKRVDVNGASVYARFFDEVSPNWTRTPEYNFLFVRCQQNYANDLLHARGHVFLNEVYDMLGLERSKAGAVVGWVIGDHGDNFVDFGVFNGSSPKARDFVNGHEGSILLDFNVDGVIYDKI